MARTSTWTTAPSTATSSGCARSSAASTTASTRSRPCTASATATRTPDPAMPDSGVLPVPVAPADTRPKRRRSRWVSPLLRRILVVNAVPLALLLAALLYLDQYQNGLLQAEVTTLREQARIYAGALGETAVREDEADRPRLVPELAR